MIKLALSLDWRRSAAARSRRSAAAAASRDYTTITDDLEQLVVMSSHQHDNTQLLDHGRLLRDHGGSSSPTGGATGTSVVSPKVKVQWGFIRGGLVTFNHCKNITSKNY